MKGNVVAKKGARGTVAREVPGSKQCVMVTWEQPMSWSRLEFQLLRVRSQFLAEVPEDGSSEVPEDRKVERQLFTPVDDDDWSRLQYPRITVASLPQSIIRSDPGPCPRGNVLRWWLQLLCQVVNSEKDELARWSDTSGLAQEVQDEVSQHLSAIAVATNERYVEVMESPWLSLLPEAALRKEFQRWDSLVQREERLVKELQSS